MQKTTLQKLTKSTPIFVWIDYWYNVKCGKVRESTHEMLGHVACFAKKNLPNLPIKKIDTECIQKMFDDLHIQGYSKSYMKKVKVLLNEVFEIAQNERKTRVNPVSDVIINPSAAEKKIVALSTCEQKAVEAACEACTNGHLLLFLLETGIRRAELRNLKWCDFNEKERCIFISASKTDKGIRTVPLTQRAYDLLTSQAKINEYVFNSQIQKPVTNMVLRNAYARVRKATGISRLTNHVCRHTFATRAVERGLEHKSISDLLGHTDINFTLNRYVNTDLKHLQRQMNLMEVAHTTSDISSLISGLNISFEEMILYLVKNQQLPKTA